MTPAETVLRGLSFFSSLRPDEVARIAPRFERLVLPPGGRLEQAATVEALRLVVVVRGRVTLEVAALGGPRRAVLAPGDRHGELALLAGTPRRALYEARGEAELAVLDRAGLDAVLAEFPVVGLPLAGELSREVAFTHDLSRQLLEVWAEGLAPDQHTAALDGRRGALARRGARVTRLSPRALFHATVVQQGREPPFWATVGFLLSLLGARGVVAFILHFGLEKRLFALVPGNDPNPMHVHHFNYGLVLIGAAGLAALFPLGRQALRGLAFTFGVGAGLVFDEFALFWNLNPEYSQVLSLYSAAVVLVALVNLTWFRGFWAALARRTMLGARRPR